MVGTEAMFAPLLRRALSCEVQFLFPKSEITGIDDFRNDVDAVFQLERDEVRLAVLDFVENRFLAGSRADVREGIVMVDGGNKKRFMRGFRVKRVVETQLRRV